MVEGFLRRAFASCGGKTLSQPSADSPLEKGAFFLFPLVLLLHKLDVLQKQLLLVTMKRATRIFALAPGVMSIKRAPRKRRSEGK
ncbi:hypothetical protein D1641_12600 [Colidextribacter sp. OB.20]|nr:hypothetical protein [Colidextribacter sp. OB.20]